QMLTEDYYVANKLAKGGFGTANIDTNSRLCMASTVAGHKRAFGADAMPTCYEDLERADLVVLVGSNAAWCHPVLFQRIQAARERDPSKKLVVIDPRRTVTCEIADLHLPLRPGTDAVLWNGLLDWLCRNGEVDYAFLEAHTRGFGEALAATRSREGVHRVAASCGLVPEHVVRFYEWFARTERVVSAYSQGIHQSTSGTDKVNAVLNCHLLTGRIGKPGAGPLSLTGQPNAMGGREVGGLANTLAAHMGFEPASVDRMRRFWGSPRVPDAPGSKAVDLFQAVGDGRIEAIWILCTNPVASLPNADRVREALERCPLVVVSDCMADTDTVRLAHVRLPAATWGEKNGTVTSSERRISRQRPLFPPPGEARPDWAVLCDVGYRMGFEGFDYDSPAEVFREHAALSGFENGGERLFDISGLADLSDAEYERLEPVQWPVPPDRRAGTARLFTEGGFVHRDGRARLVSVRPRPPAYLPDAEFPLVLNTGRVRDHWHTMTRTGSSPRLSSHVYEPYVEMHPHDAEAAGLSSGMLARVESPWGAMIARVAVFEGQRRGCVFVPIHWTGATSSHGRVGALVHPDTDPHSGQPESKHTPARVRAHEPAWYGFLFRRQAGSVDGVDHWVRVQGADHEQLEMAGSDVPSDWSAWARRLLGADAGAELLELHDAALGRYRAAFLSGGRLQGCLFASSTATLPPRGWLAGLFEDRPLDDGERLGLLAGRPASPEDDGGPIVCSCYGVGRHVLTRAIQQHQLASPEEIGTALGAGTQCGSCVPELRALLAEHAP
ncbi:MAG: molybdopterin-dependent oxidoreductase, partial [Myxococcota bacterium]